MIKGAEQLNVRVELGMGQRLSARAQKENTSKSAIVVKAIEQYLAEPIRSARASADVDEFAD